MTAPGPSPAARRRKRRRPVPGFGAAAAGPRRVAVYLRRSTDDEHQPFSIGAQETALIAYAGTQPGWTMVATYSDDASGATTRLHAIEKDTGAVPRFDIELASQRMADFKNRMNASRRRPPRAAGRDAPGSHPLPSTYQDG